MEGTSENKSNIQKKHITVGLLAHVDAGKTTLSEGLLYTAGMIRRLGRVDKQDAFLDTDSLEKERGITIFSKQAILDLPGLRITLLDTPGHVDFSAEMERTLQVLDYAILVINGADGVQGHTRTLWSLLRKYRIPVFLFVNKMDQPGTDRGRLLKELQRELSDNCVSFSEKAAAEFQESVAMCDEHALEQFLENGIVSVEEIRRLIRCRRVFPCYFGSALKMTGVEEFLRGLLDDTLPYEASRMTEGAGTDSTSGTAEGTEAFGARVFKIARDEQGNRLTYLKVTGGSLFVRDTVRSQRDGEETGERREEKVNQIRIYSGGKYQTVESVCAGEVCAVTGLTKTFPGEGLGAETRERKPLLEPVMTYRLLLPEGCDAAQALPKLRQLEEEEPELHLVWNEAHQEILVQVMGKVQTEILKRQIRDRFGLEAEFGAGRIMYRETIADVVEGVGHFEPLRHYAEVHLLLEPGERGSGMVFASDCREEILDKNWQRLILTHLKEREHVGALTGSPVTDMKITLKSGRAHQKHTEGGDFRQATYRAVRQGLKQAESVLLEPYYSYRLELPDASVGRAMTDIENMHGTMEGPQPLYGRSLLEGRAPVAAMQEYAAEVAAYTKGEGSLTLSYGGYDVCHNAQEVIDALGYDFAGDLENPAGSVFCAHGAGFVVEWDRVKDYMHLESCLTPRTDMLSAAEYASGSAYGQQNGYEPEEWMSVEEVDAILAKTGGANRRDKSLPKRQYMTSRRVVSAKGEDFRYKGKENRDVREEYLLVDGYNIIHAWPELRELSELNMDGARGRLLDILSNYQAIRSCRLIVVFDAYRVAGHKTEIFDYHNIHVVYTKEAETADAYIEKFAHENGRKYRVTVATSDGLEQVIIRGGGCLLLSAKELAQEISACAKRLKEGLKPAESGRIRLLDGMSGETAEKLRQLAGEGKESE